MPKASSHPKSQVKPDQSDNTMAQEILIEPNPNKLHQHFKLFKPFGFLSQFVPEQRKKKPLLGQLYDFPENAMAIGRLDHDSEGLLLVTTDGMVSYHIRSKSIDKEYYVQVDGDITDKAIALLQSGVEITINGNSYLTKTCKVNKLEFEPDLPERGRKIRDAKHGPTSWISITLNEGKNRQIRKMTAAVGFATLRLVRVRIGEVTIEDMLAGDVLQVDTFK